ncbi:hypothetical protein [Streptomyces sp. NBC_01092]|nr:hypothetical protein OG254_38530 [Streptomyces sp. NBC_01092]
MADFIANTTKVGDQFQPAADLHRRSHSTCGHLPFLHSPIVPPN